MAIDNTKDTVLLKSGGEAKLTDLFGATAATFTKLTVTAATVAATIDHIPTGYNSTVGYLAVTLSDGTTKVAVPYLEKT